MANRLPRYNVTLVREGSCVSEHNAVRSPEDIFAIMAQEYENAVVETDMPGRLASQNKAKQENYCKIH